MTVLALDLGTKTGYAHNLDGDDAPIVSGCNNHKPPKDESGFGYRFQGFRDNLHNWNEEVNYELDTIVYEKVDLRFGVGTQAAHVYGGFEATLKVFCLDNEIELVPVPVPTLKKYARENHNPDTVKIVRDNYRTDGKPFTETDRKLLLRKEKLMALATDIVGEIITDDNQADAICLLDYYFKELVK